MYSESILHLISSSIEKFHLKSITSFSYRTTPALTDPFGTVTKRISAIVKITIVKLDEKKQASVDNSDICGI
ncbi:hypothetical protein CHS0354_039557 [Potamilus streckersoni]|uniref:Uncharacterized protein n=1 Tax=Potamilus streckersoni TaxID=2493646 RepID=A0AAE0W2A2_9BIVA|nr:hypothetical protein CHS0354_039557 [Potamilus streckersoni]